MPFTASARTCALIRHWASFGSFLMRVPGIPKTTFVGWLSRGPISAFFYSVTGSRVMAGAVMDLRQSPQVIEGGLSKL
ncbi:MAG: hypothetical protein B7Z37_26220 [Verrucomicrobia bacterium 12-59-8]|nr:MAG: hypothetical protein B7Z37_26220 [Verrucomicrobia bacterium 12-59-8]